MRERDRLALREWRKEVAAEEAAAKEREERPIREAEEQLQKAHRELLKIERERLTGKTTDPFIRKRIGDTPLRDPTAWEGIDPQNLDTLDGYEWPREYAVAFNAESLRLYLSDHPQHKYLFDDKEFLKMIGDYYDRNKISITNGMDIKRTVERFIAAGLAPEPPAPPPPPQPPPVRVEPAQPREPEFQEGWDLETGTKRRFSRFEIDRMSSDQYVRTFRLHRAEMLPALMER